MAVPVERDATVPRVGRHLDRAREPRLEAPLRGRGLRQHTGGTRAHTGTHGVRRLFLKKAGASFLVGATATAPTRLHASMPWVRPSVSQTSASPDGKAGQGSTCKQAEEEKERGGITAQRRRGHGGEPTGPLHEAHLPYLRVKDKRPVVPRRGVDQRRLVHACVYVGRQRVWESERASVNE